MENITCSVGKMLKWENPPPTTVVERENPPLKTCPHCGECGESHVNFVVSCIECEHVFTDAREEVKEWEFNLDKQVSHDGNPPDQYEWVLYTSDTWVS